jgi:RNA polymerase sigma factor (sigma-70 family)
MGRPTERQPPLPPLSNTVDEQLAALIRRKARRLAWRPGFSHHEEEDLAQDLTLKALEAQAAYDPARGDLQAFLSSVLDNHARNLRRRRGRRPHILSLSAPARRRGDGLVELGQVITQRDLDARVGKDTPPEQEQVDRRLDVAALLDRLPPARRALAEGLCQESVTAVARRAGVPRTTVQARAAGLRRDLNRKDSEAYSESRSSGRPRAG